MLRRVGGIEVRVRGVGRGRDGLWKRELSGGARGRVMIEIRDLGVIELVYALLQKNSLSLCT